MAKVFIGATLKRLAKDLQSLVRIIEMLVAEAERQNGRAARREARRKLAADRHAPAGDEDPIEWVG